MQWWHYLNVAAGMHTAYPWMLAGLVAAFAICYFAAPSNRPRLRISAFFFALSLVGLTVAGALLDVVPSSNALYLGVRCFALFLQAVAFINVTSILLFAAALHAVHLEPPGILQDLMVGLAYLVVAVVLLSSTGLDIRGVIATSAVISAVIGFSLQDTLGNVMGGLALQIERTVAPGDWIRVDNMEGRVKETRWRQTSIETRDGDTIVIPNSLLMKSKVMLLGHRTGSPVQHRRWIYFNVDFKCSPTEVIRVIEEAIQAEPLRHVSTNPKPHCLVTDYKESYMQFVVRYWLTELANPEPADSLIRVRIASSLRRAGIPLSMPSHTLFVNHEDEAHREKARQERLERRCAVLHGLSLFQSMTEGEVSTLAGQIKEAPFVKGETVTRQGDSSECLFIIVQGAASVHIAVNGSSREIARLSAGEFFGEMGVMTGEPRTATVIAETDLVCYLLSRDAFREILCPRPQVAENISHTLAQRRLELEAAELEASEEALRERFAKTQGALLHRIRAFFGLHHEEMQKWRSE